MKRLHKWIVAMLFGVFLLPVLYSASDVRAQRGGPDGSGEWGPIIDLPLIPVGAANLPNGRVLIWAAHDELNFAGGRGETETAIFDPATGKAPQKTITENQHDMFCPGTSNLIDGRILINGGRSSEKTTIYNYANDSWKADQNMSIPRGYQANTVLPDGSVFTIGGSWSGGRGDKDGEVWTEGSGWRLTKGIPVDPILDGISDPQGVYRSDNHAWLWTASNGKVFHAGPSTEMHWFDTSGDGSHTRAGTRGDDESARSGTTVMYDAGKLLKVGGSTSYSSGDPASGSTYIIDINRDTPRVEKVDSLRLPRTMHNSVVLPNGEVLVIGGIRRAETFEDDDSRLVAELWSPQTKQWRDVAAMQVSRAYHSTAILLPDGRVFAGGGGLCGNCSANHVDAEIYSPPYLFDGNRSATRPVITSSPDSAKHGETIRVQTNSGVNAFSLIRLSSVTHSTNNDQRRIPLTPTSAGSNRYDLTIPSNAGVLPPGYYMLFAMNEDGTPSISNSIQINLATTSPPPNNSLSGQIVNTNSGKCVEVAGGGTTDRTNIQQGTCDGSAKQQWEAVSANGGFLLRNPNSGKCMDVSRVSEDDEANVWLWRCLNTDNQTLTWEGTTLKFKHSDKCLDVFQAGTNDGANLQQYTCHGREAQSFTLGEDTPDTPDTSANSPGQIVNTNSGKCVEVAGGGTTDRTNIQQGTCDGSAKQQWEAVPANGGFMLRNPNSNKCMDVSGISQDNGATIWLFRCLNTNNQILTIEGTTLKFKHSGKCLDVFRAGTNDGADLKQYGCHGREAQSFTLGANVLAMDASVQSRSGDVGCNGSVDSTDALFILQYDVGMRGGTDQCEQIQRQGRMAYLPACDLNDDSKCSGVDALWILQCDIGIDNPFCPNDEVDRE